MAQNYITHCYKITLLTNMHAGKGDANFGVIDNLVQRDHLTNYPTIYSSSLKGAIREYFEEELGWGGDEEKDKINYIFGSPPNKTDTLINGKYRFMSANLLFLPVRSTIEQYFLATVEKKIIKEFNEKIKLFNLKDKIDPGYEKMQDICSGTKPKILKGNSNKCYIEDFEVANSESVTGVLKTLNEKKYSEKLAVMPQEKFDTLANDLPVIARNQLDNGESKNLWYEEVVPHQTVFYTFISVPDVSENHFEDFNTALVSSIIQIGANASIGYGLCKFERLDNEARQDDKPEINETREDNRKKTKKVF